MHDTLQAPSKTGTTAMMRIISDDVSRYSIRMTTCVSAVHFACCLTSAEVFAGVPNCSEMAFNALPPFFASITTVADLEILERRLDSTFLKLGLGNNQKS